MRTRALLFLVLCTIVGCRSLTRSPQFAQEFQKDSVYLHNMKYDSIHIYREHKEEYRRSTAPSSCPSAAPDTVVITEVSSEHRYKLLRDTVCVVQRDSVPFEVLVTEVREVSVIPWWCKALAWVGGLFLLGTLIRLSAKTL